MKKNILLFLTASYRGGAEMEVLDYIKNFDKNKFNISIITLKKGNIEKLFQKECKKQNIFYKCFHSNKFFEIKTFFKLLKFIKEKKTHIIHANLLQPELYSFCLKLANKKIKIISSKLAFDDFKRKYIYKFLARLFASKNDKIILISKALFKFYNQKIGISKKKLKVIYCGIDDKCFNSKFSSKMLEKERKRIGISKKNFTIGIVSRLDKIKNHKTLFKAVKRLKHKIPHIKLIVIGIGNQEMKLKEWVANNNLEKEIIFLGSQENIKLLYQIMDVFCLPSFAEGFGKVIAEAVLSGTFAISSNTTAMKEIIRNNVDGLLFNPHNSDELVNKILWVYDNPKKAKKMVEEGKKHINEKFNLKRIVKEKEKVYVQI